MHSPVHSNDSSNSKHLLQHGNLHNSSCSNARSGSFQRLRSRPPADDDSLNDDDLLGSDRSRRRSAATSTAIAVDDDGGSGSVAELVPADVHGSLEYVVVPNAAPASAALASLAEGW